MIKNKAVLCVVNGAIASSAEREDQAPPDPNLHDFEISSTKS